MCFNWHGAVPRKKSSTLAPWPSWCPCWNAWTWPPSSTAICPRTRNSNSRTARVLSLLLAARLSSPTALVNVATWAEKSGADILWNIPADKLNDDRLGRALDAFFTQRHSILACVAEQALRTAGLTVQRLHFDPTHLSFYGAYDGSKPRPPDLPLPPTTPSADFPPAHLTYGHGADNLKLLQVGVSAVVDDYGALPVLGHVLDGNCNGHPAIHQQFQLLQNHLPPVPELLMVSDRGTFSAAHVARLYRHGYHVLCSVPWQDYRAFSRSIASSCFGSRPAISPSNRSAAARPAPPCRGNTMSWRPSAIN